MTKLEKAMENTDVVKRVLIENSCPSEFGLEDCEFNPETGCSLCCEDCEDNPESGCTLCCEDCWNEEVGE